MSDTSEVEYAIIDLPDFVGIDWPGAGSSFQFDMDHEIMKVTVDGQHCFVGNVSESVGTHVLYSYVEDIDPKTARDVVPQMLIKEMAPLGVATKVLTLALPIDEAFQQ